MEDDMCEKNETIFCAGKYYNFLSNGTQRAATIDAAVLAAKLNGYSGYNIDVEIDADWLLATNTMRRRWGYLWASFLSEFNYALKAENRSWILQVREVNSGNS